MMTVFTVRIEAKKRFLQLLVKRQSELRPATAIMTAILLFGTIHIQNRYLSVAVAGDLDFAVDYFVTKSGRKVDLHIYVEKGNVELTHYAMVLKRCNALG